MQAVARRVGYIQTPDPNTLNRAPSLLKPLIALAVVLVVGILLQTSILPDGWVLSEKPRANQAVAEIASHRGVRINEVMTANRSASYDEHGETGDWIELFNGSTGEVNITDWALTDRLNSVNIFRFPEYVMKPGEYVIVFADGTFKNGPNDTWHAPFKLSSAGDTLLLFDSHNTVVEAVNIPALGENESYAREQTDAWRVTNEYTPLMENTTYNYAQLTTTQVVQGAPLVINEVMASNNAYPSPSGVLCDWIEVLNRGSEPIALGGYGLSDRMDKPSRWRFPDMTLAPGECVVVYCSGLDKIIGQNEMHASFRLAAEGETVFLYAPSRQIIDTMSYENLKTNQSMARSGETWAVASTPTPGQQN